MQRPDGGSMRSEWGGAHAAALRREARRAAARRQLGWGGAALGGLWGAAVATQYIAARLAYHPHLGPWLYRVSASARGSLGSWRVACALAVIGALLSRRWRWMAVPLGLAALSLTIARHAPLYSPARLFVWYAAYHRVAAYRALFAVAWSMCGVVAIAVTLAARAAAGRPEPTDRDGSRWSINGHRMHDPTYRSLAAWGVANRGRFSPAPPLSSPADWPPPPVEPDPMHVLAGSPSPAPSEQSPPQ